MLNRWYELYAYPRVGDHFVLLYDDITERKHREQQQEFLLNLSDALPPLTDPAEITKVASEMVGKHLGVSRVGYYDIHDETFTPGPEYVDGVAPLGGEWVMQFGEVWIQEFYDNEMMVSENIDSDDRFTDEDRAFIHSQDIAAFAITMLIKEGRWVGAFAVHSKTPRRWRPDELQLIREVGGRIREAAQRGRAEEALRQSEEKYRLLFETIDEGYALWELIRGVDGKAIDFRVLEINPAFERMTGGISFKQVAGRTMYEAYGKIDQPLAEVFAKAVDENESVHFEYYFDSSKKWYRLAVYPRGGEQFAVLYDDITDRKKAEKALRESEERKTFLLKLNDALRMLADPVAVEETVTRMAMHHFGSDRCYYCVIEGDRAIIHRDASAEGLPSVAGEYALDGMPVLKAVIDAGKPFIVQDVNTTDRLDESLRQLCLQLQVISFINTPVLKNGRPTGILCVVPSTPRLWTDLDSQLVEEIAERTWAAVERAKAEADRHETDERFRILVQNIRDYAIFRIDPSGIVTEWTEGAERVKGYTPGEVIGRHLSMFYAPEDIAAGEPASELAEAAHTGRAEREGIRIRKDGQRIMVDEIATAIRDADGRLMGFTKISRDITERRRMEEAARELEKRTRIAVDAGELATWEWNVLTDQAYWNEQHFRLLGMTPQPNPVRSATFIDHIHPDDRACVEEELAKTVDQNIPYEIEFRIVRDDGIVRWMRGYGRVTEEVKGRTSQVSGVMFDVTQRREAEEELREVRERLQIILDSISDHALITSDTKGIITGWNPGAEQIFGWTPEEALGQPTALIFLPEDRLTGAHEAEMQTARQQGKAADERYHLRKDGSRLYVSGVLSPLYDIDGQLLGYVKVARDLSERQQMEEALRDAARRKDEFLAMLAHELRNPLAPIRNVLQLLHLTSEGDEMLSQSVALMSRQVDHLVRLIDDLLDVSRISRGKIELRRERIDFVALVRQAVGATRPLFDEHHRQLHVQLPSVSLYLNGDATRLTQVVTNLLTNGVRYTGEGPNGEPGQVWLSVEPAEGMARLRVRDNGIGLAPDHLEAIFELFVQVDNSLARSQGGLGLGLTLVRRLVEMHGGRVEARSPGLGQGSEFLVQLPLISEPTTEMNNPDDSANGNTTGHRILVVDDNRDAAATLSMLLKIKKYDVHTRYSGPEALEAMMNLQPTVVLLDIGMPGMDGYETARQIRQLPQGRNAVLIALTGYGQDEDKRRSQEAGFDGHLTKPFDLKGLMDLLTTRPPDGPNPS